MYNKNITRTLLLLSILIGFNGCKIPKVAQREANTGTPQAYSNTTTADSTNSATMSWRTFFTDSNLVRLIDTALANNQELMITLQEIEIAKNDIKVKKGALLPSLGLNVGLGADKVGRDTSQGAGDEST